MPQLKKHLPLITILSLATTLRLLTLLHVGDFIWDEIFSFTYSQKPWADSFRFWLWETNPPLHLIFLKFWWYLFPATEFFSRLPSLIFGVLTVAGVYVAGKQLFNERVGRTAALLLALTPYHLLLSALGRGYSLLLLLTTVSMVYFFRGFIIEETYAKSPLERNDHASQRDRGVLANDETNPPLPRPSGDWLLSLANTLLLFTHLTAALLILIETALVIIHDKKKFKRWLLCSLPLAIPGIWIIASLIAKRFNHETFGKSWFFTMHPAFSDAFAPFKLVFFGPNYNWISGLVMLAFFAGSIALVRRQIKRQTLDRNFLYLLPIVLIPLLNAVVLGLWNIKFFIIILPAIILITAYLLHYYLQKTALIIFAVAILTIPSLNFFFRFLPFSDWRVTNGYLQTHYRPNKKQMFIYSDYIEKLIVDRYLRVPLPHLPYLPPGHDPNWDRLVITGNYLQYPHELSEIRQWYDEQKLDLYDEIFLLYTPRIQVEIPIVLEEKGWHLEETTYTSPMKDSRIMYHYVKN